MISTSSGYNPFPTVRSPDALVSFEVIPRALIKENITATTAASAKMGAVGRTVNGVAELAAKYATLEQYGWKLDGSYSLIPSSGAETGFWTQEVSGIDGVFDEPVKFRYEWSDPIDTFGWTFHFDTPGMVRASQVRAEWFGANGNSLGSIEGNTEGCPRRVRMKIKAGIEPVQDLHWYDYPWAPGTNVNLYNKDNGAVKLYLSSSKVLTATNGRSVIFPCEPSTTYTVSKQAGQRFSVCYTTTYPANNVSAYGYIVDNTGTSLTITTGSNAAYLVVYVWIDGTDTCTLDEMLDTVQIEKSDHPTPYVPYSNVCQISGWTSATVKYRGGDIFTSEGASMGYWIDGSGDITDHENWLVTDYIDISEYGGVVAHEYKGEEPWVTTFLRVNLYNAEKEQIGTLAGTEAVSGQWLDRYFDTDGAAYIRFSCWQGFDEQSTLEAAHTVVTDLSGLAGTVYGGTVDVTAGKLTVDRVCVWYDGSDDEQWSMLGTSSASAYAMKIKPSNLKRQSGVITAWANYLRSISNNETWGNFDSFIAVNSSNELVTGIKSITTVDEWRTYLSQHNLQVVYKLASPVTYRFTPSKIWTTVEGGSAVADCGPVEVQYTANEYTVISSDNTGSSGGWSLQKFAENYTAVEFTFYGTNEPLRMLRLTEVDFGISRQFSADSVTDMRIVYGTSIDASAFPAKELTFTFDNSDGEFNILSPAGVYQYWRNGQVLRAKIKIGSEVVNMGMFTESTAEIGKNRLLVKVRAHDQCYHMERQKYYPDQAIKANASVKLKTAVEDVLAGYDLKVNYNGLQNELVSCRVNENHPKRTMIRYLAQAARCSVWIDRKNTLQFKRFVEPVRTNAVSKITADELYDWSGVSIAEEFSGCVLTVERELEETASGVGTSYTYTSGESEDTGTNTAMYENPCIAPGKEQDVCDWLLTAANWRKKYAVKNRCDPAVEIGDILVIEDAFHNDDAAIVTGLDVTFDGVLSCVTEAEGVIG